MSDDLISRQAVIDCLKSISNMDPKERGSIIFSVELLPSVQPKTGRWRVSDDGAFVYCSECEDSYYQIPIDPSWEYCPHCGAKMEGEAE